MAGDSLVAVVSFVVDAFLAPSERSAQPEALPDSASLIAYFRARQSGGLQSSSPPARPYVAVPKEPPVVQAPGPENIASQAKSDSGEPASLSGTISPPPDAPAIAAPAAAARPVTAPAAGRGRHLDEIAPAPQPESQESGRAAMASSPASPANDRKLLDTFQLGETPATLTSRSQEVLESSPGRNGTVDRAAMASFLEKHHEEMHPFQSGEFDALPLSPARSGVVDVAAFHALRGERPAASLPQPSAPAAPGPVVAGSPEQPLASARPETAAVPHAPATLSQPIAWPELPGWPLPWDVPLADRRSLRTYSENQWYV